MSHHLTGAAATPHAEATLAAYQAFDKGGNAVDAALAAAAMLTVVYPNQCTIGGDAIAMVGAADGTIAVINGTGRSAAALDPATYVAADGFVPVSGPKSVTVPGLLSAWQVLADTWGRRPLAEALENAAEAAQDGVAVAPGVHRDLVREQALLAQDPGCREVFFRDGAVLEAGQTLQLPHLAESLRAIAQEGTAAFYRGVVGREVLHTLRRLGSDLTVDDFARHEASIETPLATFFDGTEYLSAGGNSQGTFFLQGIAALDEVSRRLGRVPDPIGADAPIVARVLAAAARHRDEHLGDPQHTHVPFAELLATAATERLADLGMARDAATVPVARHYARRTGDTVAVVTADTDGNWVSLIQSAFHAFGSCLMDPSTGILLHNRGASFSLRPGAANELTPGRRPAHTLMPVLARQDGRTVGAHGTMGGRAQPQIHTHLALNLALGFTPAQAVERPRWIVGQMEAGATSADEPRTISIEEGVPTEATSSLTGASFTLKTLEALDDAVGHLQVIRQAPDGNGFALGSDPRSDGLSIGAR
ncbi:gamma-glutamyltransferase family protein [Kocuria sp. U4B]